MLDSIIVASLTTTLRHIPTAVLLDPQLDGVPQPCIVNLDGIQAVPKQCLDRRIVRLRTTRMQAVERAIHFALALSY
jgi:mRNA-degrading endonuclease toxin of MazEF toxin-antitoxin module